ncbi:MULTISPECIES: hypothetical protein [unclassified Nocardia]|uniref:hypothetical protein n=1 Tax=unclassified Nocardia TaxID=2637762 RepID=UPI001CE47C74|nr:MULTISPECIES: hypothetical protein [unclassified Nocardia]
MSDEIYIAPDQVKSSGDLLDSMAAAARTETDKWFDTQAVAASDNDGFSAGPKLVAYATNLHKLVNGFIDDLATNAKGIIDAANALQMVGHDNVIGLDRELTVLNGLRQEPNPGR